MTDAVVRAAAALACLARARGACLAWRDAATMPVSCAPGGGQRPGERLVRASGDGPWENLFEHLAGQAQDALDPSWPGGALGVCFSEPGRPDVFVCIAGIDREPDAGDCARLRALAAPVVPFLADYAAMSDSRREIDEMAETVRRQSEILDSINESIISMDLEGYVTSWNMGAERLFGYQAAEAIGRNILFIYTDDEEDSPLATLAEHGMHEMEVRRRRKNGEIFHASVSLTLACDAQDRPVGMIGFVRDITERVQAEEQIRLYGQILDGSTEAVLVADASGQIVSVNHAYGQITGYRPEDAIGSKLWLFACDPRQERLCQEVRQALGRTGQWQGEVWELRKSGEVYPQWNTVTEVRDTTGQVTQYISVFSDITERKNAEEKISRLAYYDSLTNLPNRTMFHSIVAQGLAVAGRGKLQCAVLSLDLDRFKNINDSLGHVAGDMLINAVAQRLKTCLRACDVIARSGGDEFVIALVNLTRLEDAALVAQKILMSVVEPYHIEDHELDVTASIGIALYPNDGEVVDTLIKNADVAMYRAKDLGRNNYVFYSQDMNARSLERLELESSLRHALERCELLLHYHPQVCLKTGRIIGAEALIRWRHPERGMVSPGQFIPLAEESGLIAPIGDWVLNTACETNRRWLDQGLPIVKIAVNLSARQFRQANLAERVVEVLGRHRLPNEYLELELTESMVMQDAERAIEMLQELKRIGVKISLDDFGTGYSSLAYLKRFPIETLKIDQSFVRNMLDDSNDAAIALSVISLAHDMKLRVIAEGVETIDQLRFLRDHDCDEIQGYYFSKPVPAEEFSIMLAEGRRLDV